MITYSAPGAQAAAALCVELWFFQVFCRQLESLPYKSDKSSAPQIAGRQGNSEKKADATAAQRAAGVRDTKRVL